MEDKPNPPTISVDDPEIPVQSELVKPVSTSTYKLLRQKWREYLIEILVIILGISLSFGLNAWKEQQSKSELEQVYLKSLESDITSDIEALNDVIDETQQVVDKAKALLAYSQQQELTTLDQAQFLRDLKGVLSRPNFIANDATFTDLRSSGNMQILTDFELKNSLFHYYKHYESIKAVETAEREATLLLVAPYISKRFSLSDYQASAPVKSKEAILSALKDTEYINSMYVRLANREELLAEYQEIRSTSKRIKEGLQKQLN